MKLSDSGLACPDRLRMYWPIYCINEPKEYWNADGMMVRSSSYRPKLRAVPVTGNPEQADQDEQIQDEGVPVFCFHLSEWWAEGECHSLANSTMPGKGEVG